MNLRNSNGIELRNFYFTTVWKLFSKMHHVELNSGTSKSSEQKNCSIITFEDIDLRESQAKLHKK